MTWLLIFSMKKNKSQKNIPNGWIVKNLDELATISRGGSPRPIEEYITKESDGLNWLRIGDIDLGAKYIFATSQKIKKEGLSRTTFVKSGDFILSNSMSFGRPYIMKIDACIHDGWLALKEIKTNLISKDFLYYLLSSKKIQNDFVSISAGSGVQNLKKETVSCVSVKLPLITEQKRIVAVLEVWDEMVEKLARKIEIKKNIKKGLMQELLSGKKRLGGFGGEWKLVRLDDVMNFYNGFTFKSSTYVEKGCYKIITIANVQDGFMSIDNAKLIEKIPHNIAEEQVLQIGDILISMTGNVGRICMVNSENCLLNQRVGKIVPKKINPKLLYLFLHDRKFLFKMIEKAQGGAQDNLSTGDIKNYQFKIPISTKEQKAIADILVTADREIEKLEEKLRIIKEQKKFLLNNLITGQIRVPVGNE